MRRVICAAASLSSALIIAVPALATAHARQHAVHITTKEATIYVTPGPTPGPPSAISEAGFFQGGSFGNGVTKTVVHLRTGTATVELFDRQGTIRGTGVFKNGTGPGGVATIVGTTTITGGTGKYAHAHGSLHIKGEHDPASGYTTTQQTGTLTY